MSSSPFLHVRTGQLVLRAVTSADGEALHLLLGDPLLWHHEPDACHTDLDQSRRWAALAAERWGDGLSYWIVTTPDSDEVIGHGGAQVHNGNHWNLSYRLRPGAQGRGYATEIAVAAREAAAAVAPDLPFVAWIAPSNTASRRVAERIGLVSRGLRRSRPGRPAELAHADRELDPVAFPLVEDEEPTTP